MSDIKVGDLVVVVRRGCSDRHLGRIFVVQDIRPSAIACKHCGTTHGFSLGMPLAFPDTEVNRGFEIGRLKRIKPLDELERDQIVKELSI
jgi:hypothetical protein